MTVRKLTACMLVTLAAGFSVALAVVVGMRMSAEAMAVVIGVVCGVGSSIPMSALILLLTRRPQPRMRSEEPAFQPRPPVVVVTPPAAQPQAHWPGYAPVYPAAAMPAPREFRVIGEE